MISLDFTVRWAVLALIGAGVSASVAFGNFVNSNQDRLVNFSVLADVSPGGPPVTIGFANQTPNGLGPQGQLLLLRAVGPTLGSAPFDVPGMVSDPSLQLAGPTSHPGNVPNQEGTPEVTQAEMLCGAFPLLFPSKDVSALQLVGIGPNTLQISSASGQGGLVLGEIYDAGSVGVTGFAPTNGSLINASCLNRISSGASLVVGFVISGPASVTVLFRAVGPTLANPPFGFSGVMPDPQFTVYEGASAVASNSGWSSTGPVAGDAAAVGAFPLAPGSKDSALELTLLPGAYTVLVTSASGSGGYALAEIYLVR